jgi:glycosyltransferase involved in cell wall biosynthesis
MTERRGGLFVGRLTAEAGSAILAEALDLYPAARIDMVGVGPEASRLRDHPRVRLLGRVASAELRARMQRAAYLVMPGLACEPEPQAVVMAFAEGLPVIASRLGGVADLVEPGRNGLLFEPGSARELARRLAWAEAFPEKMRQMGQCAQADYNARFVADWNWRRLYGERRRQARLHP